jgi:hypothetical protein
MKAVRTGFALSVFALLLGGAACKRNHPPSAPDVTGRLVYRPGDTVRLAATATDIDGDSLSYRFAWVDSAGGVWTANCANGEACTGTHVFTLADTYVVRVMARDNHGATSDWSGELSLPVGLFAPGVPQRPAGPDSGEAGDTCRYTTHAASPYQEPLRIEFDWGDARWDSCPPVPSDSPCVGTHLFRAAGSYRVRARAFDTAGLASAWSDSTIVTITRHDTTPPTVSIVSPADGATLRKGLTAIRAVATDDQLVARVEYRIEGQLKATDSVPAGDTFSYWWPDTAGQVPGLHYTIVATAFDAAGNQAADTIHTVIGQELRWYWQVPEGYGMTTSAVVASDGADEIVMSFCPDDCTFRTIKASNGQSKSSATTRFMDYEFDGHPALCPATGHVIVGSQEGELYALSLPALSRAWRWPDVPAETLEPFASFGPPAISGSDLYVGRDQEIDTMFRIYRFTDAGGSVVRSGAYVLGSTQSVVDAPAIDADGSVYFGTDGGYLHKIDKDLTSPLWQRQLTATGEVNGPVIGADGTVYCTSESTLYAIYPDGTESWAVKLAAPARRPALGRTALFVGTDEADFYSINPATGAVNWQQRLNPDGFSVNTTPVVAANGYVYAQDENDFLYCLDQADGTRIWSCDCDSYLPGRGMGATPRPRQTGLNDYPANPSITAEGDIIVVGQFALFCVAGYADGPLDQSAPWPKWQRDLDNTGKR